MQFLIKIRT